MNAPLLGMADIYWHLPIMILVISLVYSGTRFDTWDAIFREAFRWGVRMILFLAGIVLILSGLSLHDASFAFKAILIGAGTVVEVSLLFLK